ncbi:MAG: phenylalanine--tRNA ligase subunit beta [Desulfobacteraceae bacterium]|nr:phenylalanine--tRNA ligase subunit beta [Desulfobacteraceae bacterium]
MKVSLSWLRDYVDIDMDVEKLADMLTMAGLEVDSVQDRYDYLNDVVTGCISSVEPHPNADKLKICLVRTDDRDYSVVCGAPNADQGINVALALPGCTLPDGTTIKPGTIRGQKSQAMLCSAGELGLGPDFSGLMVLDANLKPGAPVNRALDLSDPVLDIDLTPNRPDCLSFLGVAREIAGFTNTGIRRPVLSSSLKGNGNINDYSSVTIESPDHCPRYAARLLDGITVGPSPFWLQDRLMSIGLRPINNLVDITNYVMMETGQPLHAFDFDNLEENRIVVRTARQSEPFTTLDGKQRVLEDDMLMICDGKKPIAIGGVMGGLNSEIEKKTKRVLIESAYFDPISIRKTAKRLGLGTDASHRFERGVDPHGALYAIDRAAQLMVQHGGARLIGETIDQKTKLARPEPICLSVTATNKVLGLNIDEQKIAELLKSIEFKVDIAEPGALKVSAPSFRVDITRPQDLMEEVARRYGYDQIPVTFPSFAASSLSMGNLPVQRQRIKEILKGAGFNEAISYSFINKTSTDKLRLPAQDSLRNMVQILNPLSEDQAVLRTSLIPGLLEIVQRNNARQTKTMLLYEIGKTFISKQSGKLPRETELLAGLWTGNRDEGGWHGKPEPFDFYDLKGKTETLFGQLKISNVKYTRLPDEDCIYTRAGASAQIHLNDQMAGIIGEVHPQVLNAYDLKQNICIFEINLIQLIDQLPQTITSSGLPKYPATSRDITLIVDKVVEAGAITAYLLQIKEQLVEGVVLFDLFEGDPIPKGQKSVSLRVTYRSKDKTLDDATVNELHSTLSQKLIKTFEADLPA